MKNHKKITPVAQLTKLLQTREQITVLFETLEPLTEIYRDDFCIACIAYIKFGIRRPFDNRVMQVLFTSVIYSTHSINPFKELPQ